MVAAVLSAVCICQQTITNRSEGQLDMYLFTADQPSVPVKTAGTPPELSDPEIQQLLRVNHEFDMRTVTNRAGYPPIKFKAQTWRAHEGIAFPQGSSRSDASTWVATPKPLCRGGKIYLASTG
ncbi:hypothetical protein QBC39DRAFT_116847 [Podospora conica]|nr:hypothetical protein QBC39DRAFT_116847 [Schizothecium conicum]